MVVIKSPQPLLFSGLNNVFQMQHEYTGQKGGKGGQFLVVFPVRGFGVRPSH